MRNHLMSSSRGLRRNLTVATLATLLAGGTVAAAAPATGSGPVVPPTGSVAGHGYPYWLGVADRIFFNDGGKPPPCQTLHADGQTVAFLDGADTDQTMRCRVAASQPIFTHGIANECSTVHGDHSGFGTSAAQLRRCARHGYVSLHLHGSASVDGAPVSGYRALTLAAPVVTAHIPAHNTFHVPAQRIRTASYGEALLLRALSPGTHRIVVRSSGPGWHQRRVFEIHVG